MNELLNGMLVLILVLNLFALGTSRLLALIRIVAAQGVLLGIIPLLLHAQPTLPAGIAALAGIVLKGIVIPLVMIRALRATQLKREIEPMIGFLPSLLLGALATVCALLFSGQLPAAGGQAGALILPASIACILTGFILLITRYKAITQIVGYLVLENGVFIFGLLLVEAIPLVVEMGMLLDLFVGIFVISIIVNRISQAFSSQDTRRLDTLKE